MILKVESTNSLKGRIKLPSSKSYSIRAFLVAACGGKSSIADPSDCDDALVAMNVSKTLGAKIIKYKRNVFQINASPGRFQGSKINVKESGTVLRLLLPLLSLYERKCIVGGEGTLNGRPNHHLTKVLRNMGASIRGKGFLESIPIMINGGKLRGGKVNIDGSLSSQFISALLIACPLLGEDTEIEIKGAKIVSQTYITMTLQIIKKAGIHIQQLTPRKFLIQGGQEYKGLKNFRVPSDYGLAAFFLAGGALIHSNLRLEGNLNNDYIQSDGQILDFLRKMGVHISKTESTIEVNGPFRLKGGDFFLKDSPDLVPIMAVMALFAQGRTRLMHVKHARMKESDRISDLRTELLKVGAKIEETENSLIIVPQENYKKDCTLNPHHDHRLAMAFSILGIKLGVRVKDIECTSKSYPGFVRDLQKAGARASLV